MAHSSFDSTRHTRFQAFVLLALFPLAALPLRCAALHPLSAVQRSLLLGYHLFALVEGFDFNFVIEFTRPLRNTHRCKSLRYRCAIVAHALRSKTFLPFSNFLRSFLLVQYLLPNVTHRGSEALLEYSPSRDHLVIHPNRTT